MDQFDCGKRYVCELGALATMVEGEKDRLRDSEKALLSILEVVFLFAIYDRDDLFRDCEFISTYNSVYGRMSDNLKMLNKKYS
jgi:hypothetical protein